jgi:hypothetical protein
MRSLTWQLIVVAAVLCGGCGSPSAPSSSAGLTLYELRIAESPLCAALTASGGPGLYGFFKFGVVTVHVKGSFSRGTFLLVDDSLATYAPQCIIQTQPILQTRPTLQLGSSSVTGTSVSGRFDGVWFPSGCPGSYLGGQSAVSGTRDATSASGTLNGTLFDGIYALNFYGHCPATDHPWSLTPVQ